MDDLRPVTGFRAFEAPPSDSAREAARSALTHAIAAESGRSRPARRRRLPRVRVFALAAGPVAAAVIIVGVFVLGSSPIGPSSAAAAVLNRLAQRIAAQPLTPQPGQYLYVDSKNDYSSTAVRANRSGPSGSCTTFALRRRQIWIGADGSGLIRETTGPTQYASAGDRAACLEEDPKGTLQSAGGTSNDWFAAQCLLAGPPGGGDWSAISTDPHELLQQMRERDGGPPTAAEDFVHVGDFLRETGAPPAVRAALYQAAALIPGVKSLGTVRDHDGRSGLGIAYDNFELIFDSQTGELLAEQTSGPGGYWATYQPEQVVDSFPSESPLPLTPPCDRGSGYSHEVAGGSVTTGAPR
jgi:RNA polymerase sigma-70 factor (ECF subfamily)